ncbi:F0F1 ATP synthase subunit delta [Leucobacter weissii]|uniref:ATP synthase subunit delta n=1 Tax=Leucobacter weissii TaxID=1983706 RepID=A0A939MLL2_9MICO|nr:F0F1 ATP synthase subunit delta [Leucobacter weissii]MBO1903008.1 F0F1 ATP synthase subunit delta [Leucobacter weissii]
MGSASRGALAVARASLGERPAASVGGELLDASARIAAAPALLSALADGSADLAAKTQLIGRLFAGASVETRAVLTAAAEQTWSSPDELVAGVEELGLRAQAAAHADLADELLAAASVIDSNHELELGLGSKLGDPAAKVALVEKLFTGKISSSALAVVAHLVADPRGRRISAALRQSARIAADQGGSELATVTVASALTPEQQTRLAGLLEQSAGRPVRVTTVVEPGLIGGVRIQIGDDVIDGSVRSRLEDLRLQLAG